MRYLICSFVLNWILFNSVWACPSGQLCDRHTDTAQGITAYLDNAKPFPITVSVDLTLINMAPIQPIPPAILIPAGQSRVLFRLQKQDRTRPWRWNYTYVYKNGSFQARHDESYSYALPFATGSRSLVIQGFNGTFSHFGESSYCVDWDLPTGSFIRAAREGVVVNLKEDSDQGGPDRSRFGNLANYVMIQHPDGTMGEYLHLQQNGSLVPLGLRVVRGQVIARSGNTGFSSGPHLHFCVTSPIDGRSRRSFPVVFETTEGPRITPIKGQVYTAR